MRAENGPIRSRAAAREQGIDLDEATLWIEGLDRIHKTRRIQRCFKLSATPFAPTGKKSTDTALFDWIISDFGFNDAIEAGLAFRPERDRVVRSRLHLDSATGIEVSKLGFEFVYELQWLAGSTPNRRSHEVRRISTLRDRIKATWLQGQCSAPPA